jgi:PAP2 superfamily
VVDEALGCDGRTDSLVDHAHHFDDAFALARTGAHLITNPHRGRWLGRLVVHSNMTALARRRCRRPGRVQANCAEPPIHPGRCEGVSHTPILAQHPPGNGLWPERRVAFLVVWLSWEHALWAAGVFLVVWLVLRARPATGRLIGAPLFAELTVMFVIYASWMRVGEIRAMSAKDAAARGRWIWRFDRRLPIPSENTLQQWALHARWLIRFANVYYIVAHVAPMGIYLVWLYVRHRDVFARWRNQLAFLSLVGAVIQLIPVAPPRLFPELGFIDTAARYGPRVYDSSGFKQAGQLAAMPSMHVGWAVLIGVAAYSAGRSRWRWLGPAHAALTIFAVTVTAYHWLLDGIVAIAILLVGLGASALAQRWRTGSTVEQSVSEPLATHR